MTALAVAAGGADGPRILMLSGSAEYKSDVDRFAFVRLLATVSFDDGACVGQYLVHF